MHSPLKRLVVPVVVVFALAIMTGFFAYFVVAPAPVSQPATLVAPPAEESPSTVGQARATDTVDAVDRLRPSDEDIVKAFQQATEDRKPMETPDAVIDTDELAITGPVPLPKSRPTPRP